VSDEEIGESLAAAVADHASIDWRSSSERLDGADSDLVHSLKVISAIGAARRASVVTADAPGARALFGLSLTVAIITIAKLALAAVAMVAGWSLVASGTVPWASSVNVLLFGAVSALSFFVPGLKYYRQRQARAA